MKKNLSFSKLLFGLLLPLLYSTLVSTSNQKKIIHLFFGDPKVEKITIKEQEIEVPDGKTNTKVKIEEYSKNKFGKNRPDIKEYFPETDFSNIALEEYGKESLGLGEVKKFIELKEIDGKLQYVFTEEYEQKKKKYNQVTQVNELIVKALGNKSSDMTNLMILIEIPRIPKDKNYLFINLAIAKYFKEIAASFDLENEEAIQKLPIYFYAREHGGQWIKKGDNEAGYDIIIEDPDQKEANKKRKEKPTTILEEYLNGYFQFFKKRKDKKIPALLGLAMKTNEPNKDGDYLLDKSKFVTKKDDLTEQITLSSTIKASWINKKIEKQEATSAAASIVVPESKPSNQERTPPKDNNGNKVVKYILIACVIIGGLVLLAAIFWPIIKKNFFPSELDTDEYDDDEYDDDEEESSEE